MRDKFRTQINMQSEVFSMRKRQRLEDLNVLDDFMLNAIANDPDVGEVFFQEVLLQGIS